MSLDKIIAYVVLHSELLIEVSIALVAVTSLYLAARAFLRNDSSAEEGASSTDLSQIEATLKKIVEQGSLSKNSSADYAAAGLTPEQVAQATELKHEVEKLKAELGHRTTQLEELKAKEAAGGAVAGDGTPSEDLSKLEARIKELESKLSEYEIISEDIADLSFYKEENQKLQKELEALKNAAPVAATPVAAPVAAQQPEAEIVGKSKVEEVVTPPPAAVVEESPSFVDDDIMAEFARAVEQQVATKPTQKQAVENSPVEEAAPVVAAAPDVVAPEAVVEVAAELPMDIPAEVPVEVVAEAEQPAPVEDAPAIEAEEVSGLGEMNLDKIVEEAQIIEANPVESTDSNVLEESLNEDKLLAEADQLNVSPEDTQAMGQFEEFVKKS